MTNVTPQQAKTNLATWLPDWLEKFVPTDIYKLWPVFFVLAVLMLIWMVWPWLNNKRKVIRKKARQKSEPEFISMQEAATRLYESESNIAGTRLSEAAEKLGNLNGPASPNERLDYLADFLCRKIAIYGRKPPAREIGQIDYSEVRRTHSSDGATILRDNTFDQSIYWVDVCVKSDQLDKLIYDLEGESGFEAGFNKIAHNIPYDRELKAMTYAQLAVELNSCDKDSPRYLVIKHEMTRRDSQLSTASERN